jgi:hypothetical protein
MCGSSSLTSPRLSCLSIRDYAALIAELQLRSGVGALSLMK